MHGAPFSREHARLGGGTGLVLQLPRAARHIGHLCRGGAGRGTGAQGGLGAWPSVPREQEIGAEQEHVEAGGAGDAGRRAGVRGRVRCKRSP